jgi:uncharacterized protein (DUF488 family)
MDKCVFTIGHSTHTIEKLIYLLNLHNITAVADVRSHPYSRINPQFNREDLHVKLTANDIRYVFMGHELGARTNDRSCYIKGRVQYDLLARTMQFQEGLDRVIQGSKNYRIALMCAEKDPLICHRSILICRHLTTRDFEVQHILDDGRLESHEEAMDRLIYELKMLKQKLILNREDLFREAYARRGEQIAYVDKRLASEEVAREPAQ